MKITKAKAEIVGVYIGDGYTYKNNNKYQIGFVGSPMTDVSLFKRVKKLIKKEWDKEVNFKVRDNGLRMIFRSKEVSDFLIGYLKLPFGKGKCEKVKIPEEIAKDWNLVKYTIRGIMDTDGTVFVSKKPRVDKYPTMEITTTSQLLAEQLRRILLKQGFIVGNIRKSTSKLSKLPAYRVPLYGKENLRKWIREIGFSNKYKLDRAKTYIQ
ncbi:hypothetical protein HY212_07215 [Candidatus Pacearchaeota archaeon]|nr:hypothetical protein [Candidatus Pacearchaeota archaeon]